MMTLILITLFILLILFSYYLGSRKAVSISYNERLISLPSYYGYYVAIWCGTPALFVCSIWTIGESWVVDKIIRSELEQIYNFTIENSQLYSTEIRNIASGMLSKEGRSAEILVAAERYSELEIIGDAGLGLSIVKHIVQVHGGEITVKSKLGKGSSFILQMPRIL